MQEHNGSPDLSEGGSGSHPKFSWDPHGTPSFASKRRFGVSSDLTCMPEHTQARVEQHMQS